jgi:hypothetical protein
MGSLRLSFTPFDTPRRMPMLEGNVGQNVPERGLHLNSVSMRSPPILYHLYTLRAATLCVCVGGKRSRVIPLEDLPEEPRHLHLICRHSREQQGDPHKVLSPGTLQLGARP